MNRIGGLRSAGFRAAGVFGFAVMMAAAPGLASAQTPAPAAPQQEDVMKFSASVPALVLIQVHADKTADFEAAWSGMRTGLAKSPNADVKAFGESLAKLFKVDQPPVAAGDAKVVIYVLQIDAPSTTISYNPYKIIWEVLWKPAEAESLLTRAEADAIFDKMKAAFQSINPPWKLIKVG